MRTTLRIFVRAPGFALLAVATLALGIGSTTAMFSIVDAIVLRGLPYHHPSRLAAVYERSDDGSLRVPSYPTWADWNTQASAVADAVEGMAFARGDAVRLPGAEGDERHIAAYVTPGFFQLLGTRPMLGRVWAPDEERPGAARVAVISMALFHQRFGGDPSIIGKTIDVDSIPTTIIGVMPHAFNFPNFGAGTALATDLWQPIAVFQATHPQLSLRGLHADARAVLRLRAGVDSARAAAAMRIIELRLAGEYPAEQSHWTSVAFTTIGDEMYGTLRPATLIISVALGLVLLLACMNVANLMLVRASVRARELAVRSALGAGRWQIARLVLLEAVVIAAAAGILGVGLAGLLLELARRGAASLLPYTAELHLDARTTVFAVIATVATALLVGMAPAIQASGSRLMDRIRTGSVGAGTAHGERRFRHALVSLQFAFAVVLLAGAALLLQSFRRIAMVNLGYDPSGVVEFGIAPGSHRYDRPADAAALYARIIDALRGVPGVTNAAAAGGALMPTPVITDEAATGRAPDQARYHLVSAEYLKVMHVPLLSGRWFTDDDMRSPAGFVISDRLARRLWPGASVLGRRITVRRSSQARADFGQPITMPVVGVVADVREYGPTDDPEPEVYLPYTVEVWPWMNFVARATDAERVAAIVQRVVHGVDPAIEFRGQPSALRSGFGAVDAQRRFLTLMLAAFAALALLIAAIGLYSIVSYGVVQRSREIGVRIALGAPRANVLRLVMRDGALFVFGGALLGLGGAVAGTRLIRSMMFDTSPADPAAFAVVVLALAIVALIATWVPARRAARTDPMTAIRAE